MKKVLSFLMCAILTLSLAACGGSPTPETEKSADLKVQYSFYENSVKKIASEMKVTPEQADEIFIVLISTGINEDITNITGSYGNDNQYKVDYPELLFRTVNLVGGVVDSVTYGSQTLYPLELTDEYLLTNVKSLIEGLTPEASRSDYEVAQAAYDELSKNLEKEIPETLIDKLSEYNLSTMTIESAVDSAIEKAGATKDNVVIGNGVVSIYLNGSDNLTNNMIRNGMLIEANNILEYLQSRPDISKISLFWTLPLVDSFGNTAEDTVMKIQLEKNTLDKINFDNFDWNKYPDIADDYFEHAALSK